MASKKTVQARATKSAKKSTAPVKGASSSGWPSTTPTGASQAAGQAGAAPTVALRGGLAVSKVRITDKRYNTKAKHNQDWWDKIVQAKGGNVKALIDGGVPSHFIAYSIRRGYLESVS